MRKNLLPDEQMSAVSTAQEWSRQLVQREARGNGDTENAMHRLEQRYGIPWRTFWSLRYRPPKSICADVWLRMRAAHEAELNHQMRKLQHEIEITKAITGLTTLLWLRLRLWWERMTTRRGDNA